MTTLDYLLGAALLWAAFKGWQGGLFRQLASIGGVLAGLVVARMLYAMVGDWIAPELGAPQTVARVLAFILIWVGVPMALSVVAFLLTKTAEGLCLGGVNRLAGAGVGVLKYCIVLSCLLHLPTAFHWIDPQRAEQSVLVRPVTNSGAFLFRCMKATWNSLPDSGTSEDGQSDSGEIKNTRGAEENTSSQSTTQPDEY